MTDDNIVTRAIEVSLQSRATYCKFLSANDSGETGAHQSGILISNSAKNMMFTAEELATTGIPKKMIHIRWQNDFSTEGCFTWYESKKEFRLTRMGRGFPFLRPEYTGALFVFAQVSPEDYEGFFVNTEDEINACLDSFGLTPAETNRIIGTDSVSPEIKEKSAIEAFIKSLSSGFPASETMSLAARTILYQSRLSKATSDRPYILADPDKILLDWTEEEYRVFCALEQARYGSLVAHGFRSVDDFVVLANQVLNRRKSRAGKSLEHHLSAIFDANEIRYTAQGITEGKKKPDFVFPSIEDYHNSLFSVEKLCTLAAKTTCKDRWRQVLNEADRMRNQNKYLCTLQQGISSAQLDEMHAEQVILVVPRQYIKTYPKEQQSRIWSVSQFVGYVREMEDL